MERKLWPEIYRLVKRLGKGNPTPGVVHQNETIVMIFLWANLFDRPVNWACQPGNWRRSWRPASFPHASTISRRLKSAPVQQILDELEDHLRSRQTPGIVQMVDGKPLSVSRYSKDPDARWGHGAGGFAKGYKLHLIWGNRAFPEAWQLQPMNAAEPQVAMQMLTRLTGAGYVLGDGVYDINQLHQRARECGYQLVAPRKFPHKGIGKRARDPGRLRCIALLETKFGQQLHHWRDSIERQLGQLTNTCFGLKPLPNWVRRLDRVRRWVQGKLILNAFYRLHHSS